jgi:hypothetical protein
MMTITTVRAALQAIARQGMCHRSLYQLGAAMGPASLYVPGVATSTRFEPLVRTDATGRAWLQAFTAPRVPRGVVAAGDRVPEYRAFTGASLLRLAGAMGSGIVLDGGTPLECRVPPRAAQSLQVAAGYTEALVSGAPAPRPAAPRGAAPRAAAPRAASPRRSRLEAAFAS